MLHKHLGVCLRPGEGNEEEELSTHLGSKHDLDFPKATPSNMCFENITEPVTLVSCYVDHKKLQVYKDSGDPCS